MEIKTLSELTTYDERVLHIPRFDFVTGEATAVQSPLEEIQHMIADCDLAPTVPEYVRTYFETCRTLHRYGCFAYEFFTIAAQRAYFVVEAALGARFVEFYPSGVPLENTKTGKTDSLTPTFFAEVAVELETGDKRTRKDRHAHADGWRVQGHPRFDGRMHSLLAWARQEKLLFGQRNQVVEGAIKRLRNYAAHPHAPSLLMPSNSARAIRDAAEIINHLWGQDTPGGRLYGTPLQPNLYFVQWATGDGGRAAGHVDALKGIPEAKRDGRWFLIEAVDADEALNWEPDYDVTGYPTRMLWSGDTWEAAVAARDAYRARKRRVRLREWRNRPFLVRMGADGMEAPRAPAQFRRLPRGQRDSPGARWFIVGADHPGDISVRPDDSGAYVFEPGLPIEVLAECNTWQEAKQKLKDLRL